ncbi:MAG: DUF2264 domain-containing protein [Spirochaetaceae bacterium]|nr:MAG: DUF2264 domain-containing protein [Spirochaetaceae bacterium]
MNRSQWVAIADRLARPVLRAASEGRLKEALRLEHHPDAHPGRLATASLEAMGRTLAGIGPWLAADGIDDAEARLRDELADMVRTALVGQSDPANPEYLGFVGSEQQTLVDAAFLAHGLMRGRSAFWDPLPTVVRERIHAGFRALRDRKPYFNNWLLFSAMTEAFLSVTGADPDPMRIDYALRQHESWYLGDGCYADGPWFHADYYNAYVIHPMLTDILLALSGVDPGWDAMWTRQRSRFTRASEVQERMIAPDGSWPVIGRSIAYRCGAFQTLAHAALLHMLPDALHPAQVRCALSATISRTLGVADSWRDDGFLRIGLVGSQPALGESYITTGSLYLAACALLPLGLPPTDAFWTEDDRPWTSVRVWQNADDVPADHALHDHGKLD